MAEYKKNESKEELLIEESYESQEEQLKENMVIADIYADMMNNIAYKYR